MGRLISTTDRQTYWWVKISNPTLLVFGATCALGTVVNVLTDKVEDVVLLGLSGATFCGVAYEVNRNTKDMIALYKLEEAANTRLQAKLIAAQEHTQTADLEAASNAQLSELGVTRTQSEVAAAYRIAELEAEYQDAVSRLQEFDLTKED